MDVNKSHVQWDLKWLHGHGLHLGWVVVLCGLEKSEVKWNIWVLHQHSFHFAGVVVLSLDQMGVDWDLVGRQFLWVGVLLIFFV